MILLQTKNLKRLESLSGIGRTLQRRIVKQLGHGSEDTALKVVNANPYRLMDVEGIGFLKADRIATKDYDLDLDDSRRHEAGNQHILAQFGPLPWTTFRQKRRELSLYNPSHENDGVIEDTGRVWLPGELTAEKYLAEWMNELYSEARDWKSNFSQTNSVIEGMDAVQAKAVHYALENPYRVMLLTGDAGTGKTHVIAEIAKAAHKKNLITQVLAFSGKAADRAREALEKAGAPASASTIHRALGLGRDGANSSSEELGADIIVLDEASMIPNWLFAMCLMARKEGARLVIVGDEAQLPPIGYGAPFVDMLTLKLPMVRLQKNYRQRDQLGILELAKAVRDRTSYPDLETEPNVQLHCKGADWVDTANVLLEDIRHANPHWDDWQCITFKNDTREMLNQGIQDSLNPHGQVIFTVRALAIEEKELEVRIGDKVIINKNDYEYDVFNGQIGIVLGIEERIPNDLEAQTKGVKVRGVLLEMRGAERWLPMDMANELLTLGYAITCHKAQGSGWKNILVIQPDKVNGQSNRWWYTAITRAEQRITVISSMGLDALWANATAKKFSADSSLFERVRGLL